jgi:hypothetical protein
LRDVRRDRVETRNVQQGSTFSMDVPSAIFEMARDMWEPPKQAKVDSCDMQFVVPTLDRTSRAKHSKEVADNI